MMNEIYFLTVLIVISGLAFSLPGAYALRLAQQSKQNGRAAYAAAEAIQEDVSRQIERMGRRIEALEQENGRLLARLDLAQAEIERLERENGRLAAAVRRLVTQVAGLGREPDVDPVVVQRVG